MKSHLYHVTLLVRNMERVKEFYTELLGFEIVPENSSPNGDYIYLHSKAHTANIALLDVNNNTFGLPVEPRGGVVIGFVVDDADALYKDWQSRSIEFLGEVVDVGVGRSFTAKDPDGNCVEIVHFYPQALEALTQKGLI